MKRYGLMMVVVCLVAATMSGCGATAGRNNILSTAIMQEQVSVPAAVDLERNGIETVTTTFSKFSRRIHDAESSGKGGQWELSGAIPGGEFLKGFHMEDNESEWGLIIGMPVIFAPRHIAEKGKYVTYSNDKQECANLWGEKISEYKPSKYNDKQWRHQFEMQYGMSLAELDSRWTDYFELNFRPKTQQESYVAEMTLAEYKEYTEWKFRNAMKTPCGGARLTNFSEEEFAEWAAKNPKATPLHKFIKHITIGAELITNPMVGVPAMIGKAAWGAYWDKDQEGFVGSAKISGWQYADRREGEAEAREQALLQQRKSIIFDARGVMMKLGVSEKKANEAVLELFQRH